jgi:hypothetical protein
LSTWKKGKQGAEKLSSWLIQRYAIKAKITKMINDILCQYGEDNEMEQSKAYDAYKQFKKRAWKEHQSWLLELAKARATMEAKLADQHTSVNKRKCKTYSFRAPRRLW